MHLLLAAAAPLGLAAAPPLVVGSPSRVAVEEDAPGQTSVELRLDVATGDPELAARLRRRLGERLLEDGYRLVPEGSAADVRVRVEWRVDGAKIEADGVARRHAAIAGADLEVALLEVQHLAAALVEDVRPGRGARSTALAVDGRADLDPELRDRLQAELLEGGVAVTRTPGPADRRVCVAEDAERLTFALVAGDQRCDGAGVTIAVDGDDSTTRRDHLAAAVIAALDATLTTDDPSPPIDDAIDEATVDAADVDLPPRRRGDRTVAAAIVAHGGVAARNDAPDGLFRGELRVGLRRGLGGSIDLGLIPSKAPGLQILDLVPTAALDWRLGFRERGVVALGVFGGVHVHTWRGEAGDAGHRIGPSVGVSAGFGAIGRRGPVFFGGVRAGWSGRSWAHLQSGEPVWRRAPLLVALTLGVGWEFTGRPRR